MSNQNMQTMQTMQTMRQKEEADRLILIGLQEQLDAALEKPDDALDAGEINRITELMDLIAGTDGITAEMSQQGIEKLMGEISRSRRLHRILWVRRGAACACFAVLIAAAGLFATGSHIRAHSDETYHYFNRSVRIDLMKEPPETTPLVPRFSGMPGNAWEAEMRQFCTENGISGDVLIPQYFPDGFHPRYDFDSESNKYVTYAWFDFERDGALIQIDLTQHDDYSSFYPMWLSSSTYHIAPYKLGDTTIHIQTEDNQYYAIFRVGKTEYFLFTENLDYDEGQHILESFFYDMNGRTTETDADALE